ncbi:hypothetical protein TCAL_07725 [Tigriopus californicus]|uniref:Pinin/SDK/MemA protein domain-containing protein n=1 Tax=Tigriopus californicus TaxID=6832 RepID=A0A553PJS0_TIGCA|nr:pinin-like [Tigriopus californicus]TRY77930.1 hypothetical protein TCAL_07725 [Tigriopus californicus]|eukprot:TCALIF_07725-PA protein Name:"Similar to PNN Pinin (Homo sapiens)" AED:0.00 eAED:0.00 QI:207/1/1/1/1/1/2/81/592
MAMATTTTNPHDPVGAPVQDFRSVLSQRLSAKQSTLKATEDTLRRYSAPHLTTNAGVYEGKPGRFQHRLGPPVNGAAGPNVEGQRPALRGRLGPVSAPGVRLAAGAARRHNRVVGPEDAGESEEPEERNVGVKSVLSRVVIEQKSREDALKEKQLDKKEVQRNRRMFGNLLGTLQRFRQDETKIKDKVEKKREIEQKIDEKTAREKQELMQEKRNLVQEKKRQQHEIRVIQVQMKRVEQFEAWEKAKRHEMNSIRTSTGHPHTIYYCPREHNELTLTKLEETMDVIENEIKDMRVKFEEDLLKIDEKVKDLTKDPELEDFYEDEPDEDEDPLKPKSQIVSAIVVPPSNESTDEKAPPPKRVAPANEADRPRKRSRPETNESNGKSPLEQDEQIKVPEKAPGPTKDDISGAKKEETSLETKPKRERYRSKSPSTLRPRSKSPLVGRQHSKSPAAPPSQKKRQSSPSPRTLKKKRASSTRKKVTPKKRRRRDSSSSNSSDSSESDSDSSQSSYSDSSSSSSSDGSRSSDSSEDERQKKRTSKKRTTTTSTRNGKKDRRRSDRDRSSKKAQDVDLRKVKKEPKIKQEVIKQEKKD